MGFKRLILLLFILGTISQSWGDLIINYSIIQANWTNLPNSYNFSVNIWLDNTKDNPIVKETPYAKFIVWIEKYTTYNNEYKIYTNATTINGYKSIYYKAELFNSSGDHPKGTSGWNPTYEWGDEDGEVWYWGAILESDFGEHSTTETPIPFPVIPIILLVIPIIILKMVKNEKDYFFIFNFISILWMSIQQSPEYGG